MSYECNFFKNIDDPSCLTVVRVVDVLSAIRNGKWKDQIEDIRSQTTKAMITKRKSKLPSVTFSGVFEDKRMDDNIVMYNHLMIIDIDDIGPRKKIMLKNSLKLDDYTYTCFDGPTKGLKVLFKIDTSEEYHKTYAFSAISKYFSDVYGITIDKTGKNISRLCFVSYDPQLIFNAKSKIFEVDFSIYEKESSRMMKVDYKKVVASETSVKAIFDRCKKMVKNSKAGSFHKGNRNHYIFVLSCLMSEFGVEQDTCFAFVAESYQSLGIKEIRTSVDSAYKRTKHSFGSRNNIGGSLGLFETF